LTSPGGVVVDVEVFCNVNPDKFPLLKDLIQRTNKRYGNAGELFSKHGKKFEGALVKFKVEQELKISLGDKLCNRHGNKGIISLIEKDELMPLTPWGERVEIILNPIGILSRMNMGQIFELYCGLISKALALRVISANNKSAIVKIIDEVYTTLDASKNQEYSKSYIKSLRDLSDSNFKLFYNQIKEMKFFPIVVVPFKSPKINQIKSAMKILNLQPGYQLYIPELGTKTIYNVPVGYLYTQKLEHLGEMKLTSRSTGQVISKTLQPTAGKKREGGQRVGEGDTYSLISYNCLKTLDELFGPLSDDQITKDEMISEIRRTGHTIHKSTKISPTRDLLASYFVSLMLVGE
jgi:DNA-directed RNA polymerase beta subunit